MKILLKKSCNVYHKWHPKVTVIQEAQDLEKLSLDELLGSLMTHELSMRRQEEIPNNKNKRVVLKVTKNEESELESSDLEDTAKLSKKFLRRFKKKSSRHFRRNRFEKTDKKDQKQEIEEGLSSIE